MNWQTSGACRPLLAKDPSLADAFFGETSASRKPAKAICGTCPVRLECLSAALERGETWGVWGGCDEVDLRRTLWLDTNGSERERRRFPRCPACRARTENLFVSSVCDIKAGTVTTVVKCGATDCGFQWAAATSVAAVEAFWEARTAADVVVPLRRPARVKVPRGRIPSSRPRGSGRATPLPALPAVPDRDVASLVASSGLPQG